MGKAQQSNGADGTAQLQLMHIPLDSGRPAPISQGPRESGKECSACGLNPADLSGYTTVQCPGCGLFFCDVACERRGVCPEHPLFGDEAADDEAAAGIGCQCHCCQDRMPPACYDCDASPCYCVSMVGPGKRWKNPAHESSSCGRAQAFGPGGKLVDCLTPTPHGPEPWNARYAQWLRRQEDAVRVPVQNS